MILLHLYIELRMQFTYEHENYIQILMFKINFCFHFVYKISCLHFKIVVSCI